MDRVQELSGASVPFQFDVHAMIFSENAPALEADLHRTFTRRRLNRMNERKEFFRVALDEIAAAAKKHRPDIEFKRVPEAEEYRKTLALLVEERQQQSVAGQPPAMDLTGSAVIESA
jgi:hypothetical protein